jgi:hypothetical protein
MARERGMSRREFLLLAGAACCAGAAGAFAAEEAKPGARVVIDGVDRFRVREPNFEGVRIVVDFLGEKYTPAYIQGISGGAFRIAGPCPCAPNCSTQMGTSDLVKLLGYDHTESILGWVDDVEDARKNMAALVPKIRDSIRARRPVLLWYAFADSSYEVVTGFDDGEGVFLGWHMHQGPNEGLAKAKQTHAQECVTQFPALGAIFIGEKTGTLDAKAAEVAALKEAVRHAHDRKVTTAPGNPGPEGLRAYDGWVARFKQPEGKRDAGDSHCHGVYRTTHRAAAGFLNEIAPRYPQAADQLRAAATEFAAEADALDSAEPLIGWSSPEQDADRNAKLWPLLAKARDHYAAGIAQIEKALPRLTAA